MSYVENEEKLNKTPVSDGEASLSGAEFDGIWTENFTTDDGRVKTGDADGQDGTDGHLGSDSESGDPRQRIEGLERKLAELNDQYLRKVADFENFRKRIVKEKQDAVEFANQSLLLDLIATLDDFERAINSAGTLSKTEADFDTFHDGIAMIEKRLLGQLENRWGLKRFDSAGAPFDPTRHEALFMEKSAGVDEPVVKEEFAKGYMLKDRVVRTAKVKVLMPE
ncbi:MAG: nucleotide exchange factor GrpE [Spirochaetaceae bacterium]|nr:nucleotide exchange factor GrpE [Spirochaetaceae bacterium]